MRGPFNARCAVLIAQRGGRPPLALNRPPLIAGGLRRLPIRNLASSLLNFKHPGPFREWLFFFPNLASGGRTAALPATLITFQTLMFGLSTRAGWKWASTPGACNAAVSVAIRFVAFVRTGPILCVSAAAQMHVSAAPLAIAIIVVVVGLWALAKTGRWNREPGSTVAGRTPWRYSTPAAGATISWECQMLSF
jgi:hypothetical protein